MDPDNNVLMARVAEGQGLGEGGKRDEKWGTSVIVSTRKITKKMRARERQ